MTLNEYLDSQGRGSAAALAKAIGASTSGVCLWRIWRAAGAHRALPGHRAGDGRQGAGGGNAA